MRRHQRASFFMTRCEYFPVRSVAASLRQTVMKNDITFTRHLMKKVNGTAVKNNLIFFILEYSLFYSLFALTICLANFLICASYIASSPPVLIAISETRASNKFTNLQAESCQNGNTGVNFR